MTKWPYIQSSTSVNDHNKPEWHNHWGVIVLLVVGVTLIIVLTYWLTLNYNSKAKKSNYPANQALLKEEKVYSVKEAIQILQDNPTQFKNKNIKIQAYHINSTKGIGCKDYMIIMDKDDVNIYESISSRLITESQTLSEQEKKNLQDKLQNLPHLITGPQLEMHNILPTKYAIYVGHFYDTWSTKSCGTDGWKRFVIEKKEKEILSNQAPTAKTEMINSGLVISNGQYLAPPYKVTLQNYTVTINDKLYEPPTKDQLINITDDTDQQRNDQFNTLVSQLQGNKLLIYGGNKYETSISIYSPTIILSIDKLLKSTISRNQKYEELKKMFDNVIPDSAIDDIMIHWQNDY